MLLFLIYNNNNNNNKRLFRLFTRITETSCLRFLTIFTEKAYPRRQLSYLP